MAAPSSFSSSSKDGTTPTMPVDIPGAATGRRAAFRRAEAARRASVGGSGLDTTAGDSLAGRGP